MGAARQFPTSGAEPSSDDVSPPGVAGEGTGETPGPSADPQPHGKAGDGTDEAPANPELKKLHDEAAKHRNRAKEAEAKATVLADQVRTLTLRLSFNAAAAAVSLTDVEAAWKLAADDLKAVDVAEDGTVDTDRLGQIVAHVADRYPYLASAPPPATNDSASFPNTEPSGASTNTKRKSTSGVDTAALELKFPALARSRPGGRRR